MTDTLSPLLRYSPDRLAREIARARRVAAQAEHVDRGALRLGGICAVEFAVGYFLAMLAFHVHGTELGQGLFAIATFVILAVPMFTVIFWVWSDQRR
jgi:hypothetical protein